MISIQCVGRRRLEVDKVDDGKYEIKIMLNKTRLATLIIPVEEFGKLGAFFDQVEEFFLLDMNNAKKK